MPLPEVFPPTSAESPGALKRVAGEALLVAVLSLTLNLIGNGRVSLWDRDEPRYAGCTREMRASGDWVHPTFNAEPRYHKPVLIYWLMLAGTAVGGENPFGARLVSAVAGAGTVLLVWAWGRRTLGVRAGRLAALILATAPLMVAESKLATTDAVLTFLVAVCQVALWELSKGPSRRAAAVFWAALGLAVLTKSPAGPVLIVASAAVSIWWGGPSGFVRRLHWRWGPLLAAAIVLPWNVAILVRSAGEYYNVAVGYHIIKRATNGIEEHGGFPGYYVVVGMASLYPWSALLPAALAAAYARRRETPLAGFLIGWVVGPLVLLECVRTKLIHYYLPAVPAVALLVAWLIDRAAEAGVGAKDWRLGRFALGMIGSVGTVTALGLTAAGFWLPVGLRGPLFALSLLFGVGTVLGLRGLLAGRTLAAVRVQIGLTAVALAVAAGWLLPAVEPYRIAAVVGRRLAALEAREGAKPVLCTFQPPCTVYTLGHPAPILRGRQEIAAAVGREGAVLTALLPQELAVLGADAVLKVEVRETVDGFNLDKGRAERLHLAVIRRSGDPTTAPAPIAERPRSTLPR